jgi:hypothetical protein
VGIIIIIVILRRMKKVKNLNKKNRKVFILNPSQSKRLIAKGVVNLPQVLNALESGKIFISKGTSNAYILEELYKVLKLEINFKKEDYVAGQIVPGDKFMKWAVNKGPAMPEIVIKKGKIIEVEDRHKEIYRFKDGDIVIKGANAIDSKGVPIVLIGSPKDGGTIGSLQSTIQAKGLEVIAPVGLEKLILGDMNEIQSIMGIEAMDFPSEGFPCGVIPMPYSTPITEIDALEILFDCEVYHVASGGVGGAEGSVSILVDALDDEEMKEMEKLMIEISSEPVFTPNL